MIKSIFGSISYYVKNTDKWLVLLCCTASVYSVVLTGIVHSELASPRVIVVQAGAALIGLIGALIMSGIDYHTMASLWKIHVPFTMGLVLLTFVLGLQRAGADDRAWLQLPFGLTLQPSELLKISFILTFSLHLSKVRDNINEFRNVVLLCIHGAVPVLLIHVQGDDGTALIFLVMFLFMMFAAGISWKYIAVAFTVGAVAVPAAWFGGLITPDQKLRFLSIINPALADPQGIDYQQYNGRVAIGSGQIFGSGIFSGDHYYVPEIHNDFIFSFIGEALGFVGCIATLVLLGAICFKIFAITRHCSDSLGYFICIGVFAMLSFQIIVNVGMCLSVLPVIGLTPPFISAGGTSVVTLYLGIGLALSVYFHNKPSLFIK